MSSPKKKSSTFTLQLPCIPTYCCQQCNCRERPPPQPARCRQQPALIRLPKRLKYLNQVQSGIFPKVCKLKELTGQIEATERDILDKETYSCYGCDVPSPDLKHPQTWAKTMHLRDRVAPKPTFFNITIIPCFQK